jgi:DNA-directed RNA polymerase subunit K/omega
MKKHGLTRVTNNRAESMNALLKRFVDWKESQVDTMILALEEISASFYSEILRGRYGRGNYHLHQDFTSLYDLEKDCPFLPEVRHEEKIFKSLKDAVGKATEMVIS